MTCASFGSFLSHELYRASRVRATASDETRRRARNPACPSDVGQRPVVVACRLEGDLARPLDSARERRHEAIEFGLGVRDAHRASLCRSAVSSNT